MKIELVGDDSVLAAAAAIEALARERGLAVTREDSPIHQVDYSLADLLCIRSSYLELALAADDPALVALRAQFPAVTFTVT